MDKTTQKLKIITGVIPVVIISLIIIGIEIRNEKCYGLADALLFTVLYGALLISFIISVRLQLIKITKGKEISYRLFNLFIIIGISSFTFWLSKTDADIFQENSILKAEFIGSNDIGRITLREKEKFSVQFGHIDWSCIRIGKYTITNDTLFLGEGIANESNGIISSRYLIQSNNYLIPLDKETQIQDSTHWMKINEIKKENWR